MIAADAESAEAFAQQYVAASLKVSGLNEAHNAMERLVDLLLEPVGRAQRAEAAAALRQQYALLSDLGYVAMRSLVA